MKASELLSHIVIFEEFIKARAVQFFNALGSFDGTNGIVDSFEYEEDIVVFKMRECTSHDCPDYTSLAIMADKLDLSDEDWNEFICKTYLETEEKQTMIKELEIERERQSDLKKLAELKAKLGE